ncbi:biopolymer transporter ExbD [Flavobacteriaceae bacterium]|jgi:biopolymer transport protein ExbD|uniref:ExbD/TolR family protein n=1 Tax=Candidatus Arcticimaribacter forsetii TaxID=2820661 RepID=UPI002076DDA6|nr:biopolymer transporter ExbD [Candidatus Arcticimaribacter forsetii]MCH1539159.1 biopolymer transporter ExbD [Flavobacteriaceae bacterium]MDA8698885.1 biopolymer transporter ExbD [Flavobacteriaceae bacterium]MDB2326094.1 biopolymer transporter ExbD [Flavobacteriaceae bacterium]MDB2457387.1 biopolymer transporter ExbD [Flavobacteriaceae bacterium]MDB4608580.1 biopolymer transporter ExbD [Flavobacteriaceae bacterium]
MNLKGRNKITPEFNMSSMTDIVFLLLIFFMIASTLSKQLDTIEVKLPQAKGKTENRSSITVSINKKNRFYIDEKSVSKSSLETQLLNVLGTSDSRVIILRAEKDVSIEEVVYVMSIANQNSIKVVLAVDSK